MANIAELSRRPLRFPDFICIGAQKAATTWLFDMLKRHPDIWLPPIKEVHYFNALHSDADRARTSPSRDKGRREMSLRLIQRTLKSRLPPDKQLERIHSESLVGLYELTDEWYGKIFQAANDISICGEITPEYALLPEAGIKHMIELQPDVKIIFILRDPIDRGWSQIKMMKKRRKIDDGSAMHRMIDAKLFLARGDYVESIERFRRYVAEKNFLVLYFDDIINRPKELLIEICAFLRVNFQQGKFEKSNKASHKGTQTAMDADLYEKMRLALKPAYDKLLTLNNPIVDGWYRTHFGQESTRSG